MPLNIVQVQDGRIKIVNAAGAVVSDTTSGSPLISKGDFEARINTLGQKLSAASTPMVIASDQSPIAVTSVPPGSRTGVAACTRALGGGTSGTLQPLQATTYTEPTTAAQRSFVSTSAADDSASTGTRTIEFGYYNNTGAGPFVETVIMDGITPVNTVATDIRFIEYIRTVTVGATGTNVGTISMYTGIGGAGTVIGSIGIGNLLLATGDYQALWAHHYVAAGSEARLFSLLVAIQAGGSQASGRFSIRKKEPLAVDAVEVSIDGGLLVLGTFQRLFTLPYEVTGFTRMTVYCIPGVNNATIAASLDWAEIP